MSRASRTGSPPRRASSCSASRRPREGAAMTTDGKQVVFLAHAIPPLRDGTYLVDAAQTIPAPAAAAYGAKVTLVVSGERFTIRGTEIDSVFPPNNATGEFDGVLPHVVFTRTTLPWERTLDTPKSSH